MLDWLIPIGAAAALWILFSLLSGKNKAGRIVAKVILAPFFTCITLLGGYVWHAFVSEWLAFIPSVLVGLAVMALMTWLIVWSYRKFRYKPKKEAPKE